jgi:hypothetical protein
VTTRKDLLTTTGSIIIIYQRFGQIPLSLFILEESSWVGCIERHSLTAFLNLASSSSTNLSLQPRARTIGGVDGRVVNSRGVQNYDISEKTVPWLSPVLSLGS